MFFHFGIAEITPTLEEIRDCIDTVGTGIERRAQKQEDIFIPNKPSIENIEDWFGLRKDFACWCQDSHMMFKDLYIRFGHASFYAAYNQEFMISCKEWNEVRPPSVCRGTVGKNGIPTRSEFEHQHQSQNARPHVVQRIRKSRNNKILPRGSSHII